MITHLLSDDLVYDKVEDALAVEVNPTVYARLRKMHLERRGDIHCGYCRYHRGENRTNFFNRNWKHYRRTQYKPHAA